MLFNNFNIVSVLIILILFFFVSLLISQFYFEGVKIRQKNRANSWAQILTPAWPTNYWASQFLRIFKIYVFVVNWANFSNLIFDCISVPRLKPYGNTERHLTTFILIRQSSTLILQNFILVSIPVISHFFAFEFFAFHISLRRNQIIFWCFLYFLQLTEASN